jgi:hypothetical protein
MKKLVFVLLLTPVFDASPTGFVIWKKQTVTSTRSVGRDLESQELRNLL